MADIKFPMTPEQALAAFDKEAARVLENLAARRDDIRRDLESNAKTASDVVAAMPPLLAKSIAFLAKDFVLNAAMKGKWNVRAHAGTGGYGDPSQVQEQTVAEVELGKGVYRAIFVLYPVE